MGWQPIDSAPKDGSSVLLYRKGDSSSFGEMGVGFFSDTGPFAELARSEGEWFSELEGDPTHWMPLPAPPGSDPGIPVYKLEDGTDEFVKK